MDWYLGVLKKYADFSGRARRKEYWYFALINGVIYMVPLVIGSALGDTLGGLLSLVALIYVLATIIPAIAVLVRRLHDTDRSGWWYFISLVPVVGGLALLFFLFQDGTTGTNNYGASPKTRD